MFLLVLFVRGNCFHSFGEEHWVVNWVQNFDSLETGFSCGFIFVYVSGFVGFVVSFLSSFLISLCFCSFNSLVWISSFLISLVFLFFCVFLIFFFVWLLFVRGNAIWNNGGMDRRVRRRRYAWWCFFVI